MNGRESEDRSGAGAPAEEERLAAAAYGPPSNAVDVTPSRDGGVLKEVRRPGTGDARPLTGDRVSVHYVGTLLDGTKFDSSRDRGEQFEFSLGTGAVIKAWDLSIATMRQGELAVLLCKSEYAYGKAGSPPNIPSDSTLVFEVELFDWKGEDVSEDKDGGILKSQFKKGDGHISPKEGASCEIHIVGRYNERVFEDRDVSLVLGEGCIVGIINGVEQALKKMKKGEHSRLVVKSKYAFHSEGCSQYQIPPNADLVYEIELKKFEKAKETWEMDTAEKLEISEISKNKGSEFFKASMFTIAVKYYKRIEEYLKSEDSLPLQGDEAEKRKNLLLAAHLNLAMCYLKLKEDYLACRSCDSALELDPKSEKGLYRRGTANLNLQNFDLSLADFNAVLAIDPQNKAAKNQIILANKQKKLFKECEKQMYSTMFKKLAAESENSRMDTATNANESKEQLVAKNLEPENSLNLEPKNSSPES